MSSMKRAILSRRLLNKSIFSRKAQPTQRAWNIAGRRGYASGGHGEQKASSDIPWAIGSIAVTVPVAGWLWSQGPSGGSHGHDDHAEHDEEHDSEETHESEGEDKGEDKDEKSEESEDDSESDAKDSKEADAEKDESKDGSKDDSKAEKKDDSDDKSESDSGPDDSGKDTPDTSDDGKTTDQDEGDGPKAASGAMHRDRSHDDKSLSKKSEGLHDTAKLTEPVDPFRKAK